MKEKSLEDILKILDNYVIKYDDIIKVGEMYRVEKNIIFINPIESETECIQKYLYKEHSMLIPTDRDNYYKYTKYLFKIIEIPRYDQNIKRIK